MGYIFDDVRVPKTLDKITYYSVRVKQRNKQHAQYKTLYENTK